ncbi:hypothetical protein [Lysobacter antibioticus]|uniref:hypothetical protein n=1 Tax=Lysobacter antibioticus TaxID=84531 RepID=UPI0011404A53|nr:hypothetical protein [Lysobacter antibioticus]
MTISGRIEQQQRNCRLLLQGSGRSATLGLSLRMPLMPGFIAKIHTGSSALGWAILCLGLAACGSPSGVSATAPQATRSEQPAPPPRSEPRPMNDTSKAPASAPKLSSAALHEKILALIQGVQGPDDLSKARVEALTHLSLGPSEVESTWSARGVLDSGSGYAFDFTRYANGDKEVQLYLPDEKRYDPQRRHSCALPLTGLHDQLKAMGYRDSEFPGPDGLPQAWQYWKGRQSLLVDYTYHDTPAGDQAACVHAITIEMIIEN